MNQKQNGALGRHMLVECHGCDAAILDKGSELERLARRAAEMAEVTVVASAHHDYQPQGASAMVLIAESHLSVHTWPEHGYAAVDIFTCGDAGRPLQACTLLATALGAKHHSIHEVGRGFVDGSDATSLTLRRVRDEDAR